MIGFYDYTVVLTYISLACSIFGMTQAGDGRFRIAIACLAISGFCDAFDGKIARTKKDRTDEEKMFGIELDSLCDVVCFGAFPAILCYVLGVRGILGIVAIVFYCICAVIRLAYFNVLEANRQKMESSNNKYYHGLPVTSISVILPLVFLTHFGLSEQVFRSLLWLMLLIVGFLFIYDFKVPKPNNIELWSLIIIAGIAVAVILLFSKYHFFHRPVLDRPPLHDIIRRWIN